MGKRPVNSTKGGKFMNPTDQARKIARKKELKRNKKLRQAVRAASIKGKDPKMIIGELENLDAVEYDPLQTPHLTDVMMRDRRRKLLHNFARISTFYQREDPDRHVEMKRILGRYDSMRREKQRFFEAVKAAQKVTIESIPMPMDLAPPSLPPLPPLPPLPNVDVDDDDDRGKKLSADLKKLDRIPLPVGGWKSKQSKGILRARPRVIRRKPGSKPPGPPPGPPPPLDEEDNVKERAIKAALEREKQLREAEILVVKALSSSDRLRTIAFSDEKSSPISQLVSPSGPQPISSGVNLLMGTLPQSNLLMGTLPQSNRGSQRTASLPPPRPGVPPPLLPPNLVPSLPRPAFATSGLRPQSPFPSGLPFVAPPGPPPGPPPANIRALAGGALVRQFGSALENVPGHLPPLQRPPVAPPFVKQQEPVLSSGPKLLQQLCITQQPQSTQQQQQLPTQQRQSEIVKGPTLMPPSDETPTRNPEADGGATIVATPVLRNKIHPGVTRFTPTAVKVKRSSQRQDLVKAKKAGKKDSRQQQESADPGSLAPSKDDPRLKANMTDMAYEDFMKEIEELL